MYEDIHLLKALEWAQRFNLVAILDSKQANFVDSYSSYDYIIAVANEALATTYQEARDLPNGLYTFGFISYELTASLCSNAQNKKIDFINAPELVLFEPQILIVKPQNETLKIEINRTNKPNKSILQEIKETAFERQGETLGKLRFKARISKDEYLNTIQELLNHIQKGNIYEINFCQEFFAQTPSINYSTLYKKLGHATQAPFSSFIKYFDIKIFCASVERFICKRGTKLISQPIKGTANLNDKDKLGTLKEVSENIMVTDLVRNDLAKVCLNSSVVVEELGKTYTFKTLLHLISTISCNIGNKFNPIDIVFAMFPPASMTGVPKRKATELINQYEVSRRGIYSGSIGYITPDGNFDFNVVIRTLIYNQKTNYLSLHTGGAITARSNPFNEYTESLSKAEAILKIFS